MPPTSRTAVSDAYYQGRTASPARRFDEATVVVGVSNKISSVASMLQAYQVRTEAATHKLASVIEVCFVSTSSKFGHVRECVRVCATVGMPASSLASFGQVLVGIVKSRNLC